MKFRHGVIFTLALALSAAFAPAYAQTETQAETQTGVYQLDIQAQPLSGALKALADQTGVQVVFFTEVTQGEQSPPVSGDYTIEQALDAMLAGTGLVHEYLGEDGQSVTVRRPAPDTVGQRQPGIEEIIVTGQKKEERIQDVPIAISAFSAEDLDAQKLEGGFDLLKAVPNVTFTKTNFTSYNFQIRGIGTQAVSATTDPGVAVSLNNTTLIVNRLFEQEYLDVERVEVLRGPQGTLFGRNATAGVINVITNKPEMGIWDGMIDVEVGNYNARRLRGFFNAPLGDDFAIRGAYVSTQRDGYGINQAADDFDVRPDVDNRDLWTGRLTLGWEPIDALRVNLMWERFEEDDRRVRSTKQLCHRDEGLTEVGGFDITSSQYERSIRSVLNQGCLPRSLYDDGAYDTPNGDALPFASGGRENGFFFLAAFSGVIGFNPNMGNPSAPCPAAARDIGLSLVDQCVDIFANRDQSRDLRTIYSRIEPSYRAKADIYELSLDYQWTDALTFSSQTVYVDDKLYSTQDYNRFEISPGLFNDISGPMVAPQYADFAPDGVFCDPQLGCSDSLLIQDVSRADSTQFNQEVRLVSGFSGDWNFSLGANYTRFETSNDYFIFSNLLTALAQTPPFDGPEAKCTETGGEQGCIYIDPNPLDSINAEGHNYFRSANPYELDSAAVFGELYWQATDTVKLTAGLRYTWDQKVFTPIPSQTLLSDYRQEASGQAYVDEGAPPEACDQLTVLCGIYGNAPGGRGYPEAPDIVQEWREPTGRLVVDWQPLLGFTDETLLYASFSRGYKGGGANPPSVAPPAGLFIEDAQGAVAPRTFEPEYVNAYEIGTKNTLFGGALVLNGAAFLYDYTDYQVSKIVDRSANNENFDATVWGLELESIFAPSLDWQFNAAIGFLQTEVAQGEQSIDLMDRTQGGNQSYTTPDGRTFDEWVVLKPNPTQTSNCVAPAELVSSAVQDGGVLVNGVPLPNPFIGVPHSFLLNPFCAGGNILGSTFAEPEDDDFALFPASLASGEFYDPVTDAPNGGAGFFADVGGNELPNSPEFTVSLGGQYNFDLTRDWRATARVDWYWQGKSYARIYNTEYDRLKSWSNTNLSLWVNNPTNGITVEAYVKNIFDETPITGTFLNSDDTGLTTNVFTLDPRLIGVSIRKEF